MTCQPNWGLAYALLSMDRVASFYEVMEVPMEPSRLQPSVRNAIVVNRKYFQDAPTNVNIHRIAERVLQNELGSDSCSTIHDWILRSFVDDGVSKRDWSVWKIVFQHLIGDRAYLSEIWGKSYHSVKVNFNEFLATTEIANQVASAKSTALSAWDLELYARHGWNDSDTVYDPFVFIELTATLVGFKKFFRNVVVKGNEEKLINFATDLLRKLDIDKSIEIAHPLEMIARA